MTVVQTHIERTSEIYYHMKEGISKMIGSVKEGFRNWYIVTEKLKH